MAENLLLALQRMKGPYNVHVHGISRGQRLPVPLREGIFFNSLYDEIKLSQVFLNRMLGQLGLKQVIFDLDGTLSLLRKGWPVMMRRTAMEKMEESGIAKELIA